ncbi:hypothetical protein D3C86_1628630 [compost metagenome]
MPDAAYAIRTENKLSRLGLHGVDQLLHSRDTGFVAGHDDHRRGAHRAHRLEILQGVEGNGHPPGAADQRSDHLRRKRAKVDRVSIGRQLQQLLHCQNALGSRLVLDNHGLPDIARDLVYIGAGGEIGGATRWVRNDEPDRLGEQVRLRLGRDEHRRGQGAPYKQPETG